MFIHWIYLGAHLIIIHLQLEEFVQINNNTFSFIDLSWGKISLCL